MPESPIALDNLLKYLSSFTWSKVQVTVRPLHSFRPLHEQGSMRFFPQKIDSLIAQIRTGTIKALLFYGPNIGLIDSCYKKIASTLGYSEKAVPYSEVNIETIECLLGSLSLFSEKELIKITEVGVAIDKSLLKALENSTFQNLPVFIAKELNKNSSIRSIFESSKWSAAIACYAPEDSKAMIETAFREYLITPEAKEYLILNLGTDHFTFSEEVAKLKILFTKDHKITIQDVQDVVCTTLTVALDELFIAFAEKNFPKYLEKLSIARQNGATDISVIRSLVRYYINLHLVLNSRQPLEKAISELKNPVFFKYLEAFSKIASTTSKSTVKKMLMVLYKSEKALKQGFFSQVLDSLYLYE